VPLILFRVFTNSRKTNLGLRLFQEAAARAAVHAGMEIDQEPRPEPTEEATCDDPEVCRLSLDPVIVLGKSINVINIQMRAQPGSMPCLVLFRVFMELRKLLSGSGFFRWRQQYMLV
jgi:hypothetical protein